MAIPPFQLFEIKPLGSSFTLVCCSETMFYPSGSSVDYLRNLFRMEVLLIICSANALVTSSSRCCLYYSKSLLTGFSASGLISSSECIQHNSQRDPVETCQFMQLTCPKPSPSISSRIIALLLTQQPAHPLLIYSFPVLHSPLQ